jgi:hypothetical protein
MNRKFVLHHLTEAHEALRQMLEEARQDTEWANAASTKMSSVVIITKKVSDHCGCRAACSENSNSHCD